MIEEALLELGLFRDTAQPPPDHRMMWNLGLLPDHCPHGVHQTHTCIKCKVERIESEEAA